MEGSTGRQRVPMSIFRKKIMITFPNDRKLQRDIVDEIEAIDSLVEAKIQAIKSLKTLREAMTQRLVRSHSES